MTADCYEFGPFRLDCRTRELRRADEVVALTPKAFDLLRLLVAADGRVVEKAELLRLIWPDSFVTEDSLTQNIALLRKALGDTADRPQYILTVPRSGYRFVAPVRAISNTVAPVGAPAEPVSTARAFEPTNRAAPMPWARVLVLLALTLPAAALAVWFLRSPSSRAASPPLAVRFIVPPPEGTTFSPSASFLAVSPNGQLIAFLAARDGGPSRVWVRPIESVTARELAGTDGALSPFWSADSSTVGFFADGRLKTVTLLGEPPKVLCAAEPSTPSATWNRDGVILFSQGRAISRIDSTGGMPRPVTTVDPRRGEATHILPHFLPDGRHFLYMTRGAAGGASETWIVVQSLDESEHRQLIRASSQAVYADPGYLLFVDDEALLAQPFDAVRLEVKGRAVRVVGTEHIGWNSATPRGMFAVSQTGLLAYRSSTVRELGWFDRSGRPLGWIGEPGRDSDPALSPDGQRVAVSRYDPATLSRNIWILDARTGVASRLTSHQSWAACPLWSPDGTRIMFTSGQEGVGQVFQKRLDGSDEARALDPPQPGCPVDWLPDGHLLVTRAVDMPGRVSQASVRELWGVAVASASAPAPLIGPWSSITKPVASNDRPWARLSPAGRWIAYVSGASGRNEVYVQPFPNGQRDARQISEHGGIEPQWRADGRELFFLAADKQLMSVQLASDAAFRTAKPSALFMTGLYLDRVGITGRNQYLASPSGDRFLINQSRPGAAPPPIIVLLNWTAASRE